MKRSIARALGLLLVPLLAFSAPGGGYAEPAPLSMTAHVWIHDFLAEAEARGMPLTESFWYEPGIHTGQHSYNITIAQTPDYSIGFSIFSEDGVAISSCSMRLASAMLRSDELVEAARALWAAVGCMIAASDPASVPADEAALRAALCEDLPAALLRGEEVDARFTLRGITYLLWAGEAPGAFLGESDIPFDGYLADFVVSVGVPDDWEPDDDSGPEDTDAAEPTETTMPQAAPD